MKRQKFFLLLLVCFLALGLALVSCEITIYDGFHVDVGGVDVGGVDVGGVGAGNGTPSSSGGAAVEPNPPAPPTGPGNGEPLAPPAGPGATPPAPPA